MSLSTLSKTTFAQNSPSTSQKARRCWTATRLAFGGTATRLAFGGPRGFRGQIDGLAPHLLCL